MSTAYSWEISEKIYRICFRLSQVTSSWHLPRYFLQCLWRLVRGYLLANGVCVQYVFPPENWNLACWKGWKEHMRNRDISRRITTLWWLGIASCPIRCPSCLVDVSDLLFDFDGKTWLRMDAAIAGLILIVMAGYTFLSILVWNITLPVTSPKRICWSDGGGMCGGRRISGLAGNSASNP